MSIEDDPDVFSEFEVDMTEARTLSADALCDQINEVFSMRSAIARCERSLFELEEGYAQLDETSRKELFGAIQTAVAIADELGRLVDDANRNLAVDDQSEERQDSGFFKSLFSGHSAESPAVASEWLSVFARLASSATHRLESHYDVHAVSLLGEDVQELQFDGQSVTRWVSVKNRSKSSVMRVRQVIHGLWIAKWNGKLLPIQRGEVVV